MKKPTKKYRLLIDSPEYPNGTIATQDPDGDYFVIFGEENTGVRQYLNKMQIENRPEVWAPIEEPKPSFKKWMAEHRRLYFYTGDDGGVHEAIESCNPISSYRYLTGNYFQTREEAEAYKARQEAIGRVTHAIIEANEGWEPDWDDITEPKYSILYNHETQKLKVASSLATQGAYIFPALQNHYIAGKIRTSHEQDLLLIFNVKYRTNNNSYNRYSTRGLCRRGETLNLHTKFL